MPTSQEGLFRKAALEFHLRGEEGGRIVRVSPPWTWTLFWIAGSFLATGLLFSIFGKVEVNDRGRGALKGGAGVRQLVAQVGGTVAKVETASGADVHSGDPLMALDSAQLQSQMLEAERQLQLLRSDHQEYVGKEDISFEQQRRTLDFRLSMLQEQVGSQEQSLEIYRHKIDASNRLFQAGLVSQSNVEEAREALAQAERQVGTMKMALAQARQERASLDSQRQNDLWKRESDLRSAQTRRDALAYSIAQSRILAPMDGRVEALLVQPGDVVQAGQELGKLIPVSGTVQVVAFLPEKDRAFVHPGDMASLELDQYPYAEFGSIKSRVVRISGDLASPYEIQAVLGHDAKLDGAFYPVELEVDAEGAGRAHISLRPGMLMNIRFNLRSQRLITVVLEPLRRWLD